MFFKAHFVFLWLIDLGLMFGSFQTIGSSVNGKCSMNKYIFTKTFGEIHQHGGGVVASLSACEWLIRGVSGERIRLNFNLTDSSFGFNRFFIHDGNSLQSSLLASVTGTQKDVVLISSGASVYLILHTDNNAHQQTLDLYYEKINCTNQKPPSKNAQNTPKQFDHFYCPCLCEGDLWRECNQSCYYCANSLVANTACLFFHQNIKCSDSRYGEHCAIKDGANAKNGNLWFMLTHRNRSKLFAKRASHVSGYVRSTDTLFVYGGYSFAKIYDDLIAFNFSSNEWELVDVERKSGVYKRPPPLYNHAGVVYNEMFIIFGGEKNNQQLSNELWVYDLNSGIWKPRLHASSPVAGHTMTLVGSKLYVIGGRTSDGYLTDILIFDIDSQKWEDLTPMFGKPSTLRMYGHSACYYRPMNSIIVFGGFQPTNRLNYAESTKNIRVYNVDENVWSLIKQNTPSSTLQPPPTAFHVAAIVGDVMFIHGGWAQGKTNFHVSHKIYYYNLKCHVWYGEKLLKGSGFHGNNVPGKINKPLFSHSMAVKDVRTLILSGGSGRSGPVSRVTAFKIPKGKSCSNFNVKPACSVFTACEDCSAQSQCHWCRLTSACLDKATNHACPDVNLKTGWWNKDQFSFSDQHIIDSPLKCQSKDRPPGLTMVHYYHPKDNRYPIQVKILDIIEWQHGKKDAVNEISLLGRIHPYVGVSIQNRYSVQLRARSAKLWLNISKENASPVTGLVMQLINPSFNLMERKIENQRDPPNQNLRIFPVSKAKNGGELWYEFVLGGIIYYHSIPMLQLLYLSGNSWEFFQKAMLQPYHTDNCQQYKSCMSCIIDASCGWCPPQGVCMKIGGGKDRILCKDQSKEFYLNRRQEQCTVCEDHINCQTCNEDKLCSWSPTKGCIQRTSSEGMNKCEPSCNSRTTAELCVENGDCIWCTGRGKCLSAAQFFLFNQFGQCGVFLRKDANSCKTSGICEDCLKKFSCGWLYNKTSPRNASCVSGDLSGPQLQFSLTSWIYDTQKRNRKLVCIIPCWPPCSEHGTCNKDFVCDCHLGWKGKQCNIDCGCHGHSTCVNQVGVCDRCQDYTTGLHCERCVNGSYGNATSRDIGCKKCHCNGYGDRRRNKCHPKTGQCFCTINTAGNHCEKCMEHFMGDPKKNDVCVLGCSRSTILKNATSGYIASYSEDIKPNPTIAGGCEYCLWTITSFDTGHEDIIYYRKNVSGHVNNAHVLFTIRELRLPCFNSSLEIFDGIPPNPRYSSFSASQASSSINTLGSICGVMSQPQYFRATSGILTLVYHGALLKTPIKISSVSIGDNDGFLGEFTVLKCPGSCPAPFKCYNGTCMCPDGLTGATCEVRLSKKYCSSLKNQEQFDQDCGTVNKSSNVSSQHVVAVSSNNLSQTTATGGMKTRYPSNVYGSTLEHYRGRLYLFGNADLKKRSKKEHYFHTCTLNSCQLIAAKMNGKNMPSNRHFHCSFIHKDRMFIYGGITRDGITEEIWAFNFNTAKWTRHDIV